MPWNTLSTRGGERTMMVLDERLCGERITSCTPLRRFGNCPLSFTRKLQNNVQKENMISEVWVGEVWDCNDQKWALLTVLTPMTEISFAECVNCKKDWSYILTVRGVTLSTGEGNLTPTWSLSVVQPWCFGLHRQTDSCLMPSLGRLGLISSGWIMSICVRANIHLTY